MRQDLSNQLKPTELKLNKCMHTATGIKWALILVTIKILSLCLICVCFIIINTSPFLSLTPSFRFSASQQLSFDQLLGNLKA